MQLLLLRPTCWGRNKPASHRIRGGGYQLSIAGGKKFFAMEEALIFGKFQIGVWQRFAKIGHDIVDLRCPL
jgi:hypothetical protein